MKIKKIVTILVAVLLIVIFVLVLLPEKEEKAKKVIETKDNAKLKLIDTYSYLDDIEISEELKYGANLPEFEEEFTPEYLLNNSDAVVIASIISLEKADKNLDPWFGTTYGKLAINNSLYGNLKEGSIINYARSGGIMTLEESDKSSPVEAHEKHQQMWEQNNINPKEVYINTSSFEDISTEAGKTYLCYLTYINDYDLYAIIGFEYGLRELNIKKARSVNPGPLDINKYQILNNNTKKYESLSEYINNNIPKE